MREAQQKQSQFQYLDIFLNTGLKKSYISAKKAVKAQLFQEKLAKTLIFGTDPKKFLNFAFPCYIST